MSTTHRLIEKDFLKGFLSEVVFSQLTSHFKGTKKWKSLDNAYVNFTHWAPVMGHDSDCAFTKEGFFANWIRHKALGVRHRRLRLNVIHCDLGEKQIQ